MQSVITLPTRLLAAVLAVALSTAVYTATSPGEDLTPVGGAAQLVQIVQDNALIRWTALTGNVVSHTVTGWPVEIDGQQLGGGMVIERPADGGAGVIDIGEKPMSVEFQIDG